MKKYIDKPIKTAADDFLGRKKFAADLAEAISSYNNEDSLVLGLLGPWGSGKTSIINLVEEEMEKSTIDVDSKPILTIRFEPWNISNQDNLISQFFSAINYKLKNPDINEVVKNTGKVIKAASNTIGFVGKLPIPVFSDVARALEPLLKDYSEVLIGLAKDKSLAEIKLKIENQLNKLDGKLLIIIDDIDRLNIKEIAQIFQLVKAVADFPNTIYLLSFERDTVVRALANGHVTNGEQYLEKMIQIPFEVPMAPVFKVREKFSEEVLEIIKNDDSIMNDVTTKYFQESLEIVIYPFLEDARKMYRLLALFRFKYDAIGKEVNEIDLLNICAIEIFNTVLCDWIKKYKDILVGNIDKSYQYDWNEVNIKEYADQLEKYLDLSKLNNKTNKKIIEILFPNSYFETKERQSNKNKLGLGMYLESVFRVGSFKYFDRYFSLSLETNELTKEELKYYTQEAKKDEVLNFIDYDTQKTEQYMGYILCHTDYLVYDKKRVTELIGIMLELGSYSLINGKLKKDAFEEDDLVRADISPRRYKAKNIIYKLLEKIVNPDTRFCILQQELETAETPRIEILKILIGELEYQYGGSDGTGPKSDKPLLEQDKVKILQKKLQEKMQGG